MKKKVLLLLALCAAMAHAQIDAGLVAHYMFNDDYSDASGNGHNGSVIGTPEFVEGISGKALLFHGLDAAEPEAVNTKIQFEPEGSFSISLFFKLNKWELDSKFGNVLIADRGEGSEGFQVRQYANAADWPEISDLDGSWICFTTRGVASDKSFDPRQGPESTDIRYPEDMPYMEALYPGEFVHFVGVVDLDNMKKQIWLDKQLVVDAAITDPNVYGWAFEGDYVMIGARNDGSGNGTVESSFNGAIDEVRLYDKALSQTDIEAIYASTVSTNTDDISSHADGLKITSLDGNLQYTLLLATLGAIQTDVYDMSGRLLQQSTLSGNAGLNTVVVPARNLAKGVYVVKVTHEGTLNTQKVMIR